MKRRKLYRLMVMMMVLPLLLCGGCKQAEAADTCVTAFLAAMEAGNREDMQNCVSSSEDGTVTALMNVYDKASLETTLSAVFSDAALDNDAVAACDDLASAYLNALFQSTAIRETHHEGHGFYSVTVNAVMAYESRLSDEMYGLLGDAVGNFSDDLYNGVALGDSASLTSAAARTLTFAAERLSASLTTDDYHSVTFVFTVQDEDGSFYITSVSVQ